MCAKIVYWIQSQSISMPVSMTVLHSSYIARCFIYGLQFDIFSDFRTQPSTSEFELNKMKTKMGSYQKYVIRSLWWCHWRYHQIWLTKKNDMFDTLLYCLQMINDLVSFAYHFAPIELCKLFVWAVVLDPTLAVTVWKLGGVCETSKSTLQVYRGWIYVPGQSVVCQRYFLLFHSNWPFPKILFFKTCVCVCVCT